MASLTAWMERTSKVVADGMARMHAELVADLAEGRTPEGLPRIGNGAKGRRIAITTTAMSRRGALTDEAAADIWRMYTEAMWADEAAADIADHARDVLCTGSISDLPLWVCATPEVDALADQVLKGLADPAASNAPPPRDEFNANARGG
jgi:hypothetical protein